MLEIIRANVLLQLTHTFRDRQAGALATWLALVVVLLMGAWLRVGSHNWDQGEQLNVDEYHITKLTVQRVQIPPGTSLSTLFDPQNSPMNPRADGTEYPYGTLPLYLGKAASTIALLVTGDQYFSSFNGTQQTGRVLSGLLDTLVALVVFLVGRRIWGTAVGLTAAAFYALAALPIQIGHFYISDGFMSAAMSVVLLCSVIYYQSGKVWTLGLAGLFSGLALACKLSSAPVLLLVVGAALGRWIIERRRPDASQGRLRLPLLLGMTGAGIAVGLFAGDPFALLDAPTYLKQLNEQATIQAGANDQWFTRKYVGTWPVLYPWSQLLIGVGPIVGLAGTAGVVWACGRLRWERRWEEGLLLLGGGAYFASVAFLEAKWVRYLLPVAPYLCLFAASFGLWLAGKLARNSSKILLPLQLSILSILLVPALLEAVAVNAIYLGQHTQVKASRWIYDRVPAGSSVGLETTTQQMPLSIPGEPDPEKSYKLVSWDPLADKPGEETSATLRSELGQVGYLVIDATQAYRTVPHLPWRYPVQIRYYQLLFSGELGFDMAYASKSYPTIFGVQIPDDNGWVDASYMDSSHPPIYIFKKQRALSDAQWAALFANAVKQPSTATRRAP